MALILDTGPIYAAMDRSDPDHAACSELLSSAEDSLVVPVPVLVEVEWLATKRLGASAFDSVFASIVDGGLMVHDLDRDDWARVRSLCQTYADLPLGLVDASVVATAERLGERTVASLDRRHFSVVRPRHAPVLALIPA